MKNSRQEKSLEIISTENVETQEQLLARLQEMGIVINDLHSLVAPDIGRYICDDQLHLSEEGAKLCAEQVAQMIRKCDADVSV